METIPNTIFVFSSGKREIYNFISMTLERWIVPVKREKFTVTSSAAVLEIPSQVL